MLSYSIKLVLYLNILVSSHVVQGTEDPVLAEYNAYCGGEVRCNPQSALVCSDTHKCDCIEGSFYDPEKKACVAYVGTNIECDPPTTSKKNRPYALRQCPQNSKCEPIYKTYEKMGIPPTLVKRLRGPGIYRHHDFHSCSCDPGYIDNSDWKGCHPTLGYGETCSDAKTKSTGIECDKSAGLTCSSAGNGKTKGVCECFDHEASFHESNGLCVTPIGAPCTDGPVNGYGQATYCGKNAVCSQTYSRVMLGLNWANYHRHLNHFINDRRKLGPSKKSKKLIHSDKRRIHPRKSECMCLPGYILNKNGSCVGTYGSSCLSNEDCNADGFLSCVDGVCQCQHGTSQSYSEEEEGLSCFSLVGAKCSNDSASPKCASNATCSETSGLCTCSEGYSEAPLSGICLHTHKSNCSTSDSCNYFEGLACIDGICQCFDTSLTWNDTSGACEIGQGGRCGEFDKIITKTSESEHSYLFSRIHLHRKGIYDIIDGHSVEGAYFVGCANGLTCEKQVGPTGWTRSTCTKKI